MKLNIIGIGTCRSEDFKNEELDRLTSIKSIPVKGLMPSSLKRLSSRLAKIFYIAVNNAFMDANLQDHTSIPIIAGTGISEVHAGQELVKQIYENRGASISPTLVQNSVHNAPASFLSIGLNNKCPVITIAHSFLSWEASVAYAFTLFATSSYNKILVVAGDQYVAQWNDLLEAGGQINLSKSLKKQNFKEGALALILSIDNNEIKNYAKIIRSGVFHVPSLQTISRELINRLGFQLLDNSILVVRETSFSIIPNKQRLAKLLNFPIENIIHFSPDNGISLATPFSQILDQFENLNNKHILLINSEFNDIGIVEILF